MSFSQDLGIEPIILSVPSDEANILVDCSDKDAYSSVGLSVTIGSRALYLARIDDKPIQIRHMDLLDPRVEGTYGLEVPLAAIILESTNSAGQWVVPDYLPVRDYDAMDLFAHLVSGFVTKKIRKDNLGY